ncbi:hypothetical protein AGLY_013387 [Aphis glycines]|uniref:Uncharacterized protein n=1 Tax=Aphis glycines TaxID=307491 RepID=A0A6G0T898_APHGL|nr:hypothetical protein AGLY_013387 [Aphis glycines]
MASPFDQISTLFQMSTKTSEVQIALSSMYYFKISACISGNCKRSLARNLNNYFIVYIRFINVSCINLCKHKTVANALPPGAEHISNTLSPSFKSRANTAPDLGCGNGEKSPRSNNFLHSIGNVGILESIHSFHENLLQDQLIYFHHVLLLINFHEFLNIIFTKSPKLLITAIYLCGDNSANRNDFHLFPKTEPTNPMCFFCSYVNY